MDLKVMRPEQGLHELAARVLAGLAPVLAEEAPDFGSGMRAICRALREVAEEHPEVQLVQGSAERAWLLWALLP